jgi:hypothetical protein
MTTTSATTQRRREHLLSRMKRGKRMTLKNEEEEGKKTRVGRRSGGPGSSLRWSKASGATISTSRRRTKLGRFLLDKNSAHGEHRGLLAQVRPLFFIYAASVRRRSRPMCMAATPPLLPPTCAVPPARSRDPALALTTIITLVN